MYKGRRRLPEVKSLVFNLIKPKHFRTLLVPNYIGVMAMEDGV